MNPEEKRMLTETLKLSRETHVLIKNMRRGFMVGRIIKTIYWLILIGITVGAFYFIQPYLDTIKGFYGGAGDPRDSLQGLTSR